MFVNKNAIKSDFGNISDKVGISHIGWELLWEFGNWAWEFLCFGSSNTGEFGELFGYSLTVTVTTRNIYSENIPRV